MNNIINAIEEKLQKNKDELNYKDWKISDLKTKLEKAEKEIERLKGRKTDVEQDSVNGAADG